MICFHCKKRIPEGEERCPSCGAFQGFDEALIRRAEGGDQDAIAELYEKTRDNVYYTVKSVIKDEDTVLDLVQDSFVRAFENLDKLNDPTKFRPWIKTIARNMSINYLNRKKPTLFSEMSDEEDYDPSLSFEDDRLENLPDVVVDRKETTRLMREILDSLSEDQRLVVGLFYYQNMSIRRIAERLGVSENTVKSRLFQGRKKIEAKVKELEKQGTKLYSVSPIALLLLLYRSQDSFAARIPAEDLFAEITQELASGALPAGQTQAAAQTAKAAAKSTAKSTAKTTAETAAKSTAGAAAKGAGTAAAKGAGTAVATRVLAAVAAVALLGGGGVAVANRAAAHRSQAAAEPTAYTQGLESAVTPLAEARDNETAHTAYEQLLSTYRDAMQTETALPGVDQAALDFYLGLRPSGADQPYAELDYSYYDLNGDGMDELFLSQGYMFNGQCMEREVFDILTFDGSQALSLMPGIPQGTPGRYLEVLQDGRLYCQLGGNAGAGESYLFRLPAYGDALELVERVERVESDSDFRYQSSLGGPVMTLQEYQQAYPGNSWVELNYTDILSGVAAESGEESPYERAKQETLDTWVKLMGHEYQDYNIDYYSPDDVLPGIPGAGVFLALFYGKEPLYYAEYDFDGNGVDELVIAHVQESYTQVLAVYAFDGQQMRYLFRDNILAERTYLSGYDPEAKTLTVHGSGGATTGGDTTYRFNPDGYTLEIVEQYDYFMVGSPDEEFNSTVGDMTLEKLKQRWADGTGNGNWFREGHLQFVQLTEKGGAPVNRTVSASAAASIGQEQSLYAAYVRANDFSDRSVFALYDIDGDGLQELLAIRCPKDNYMDVYMEAYHLEDGQVSLVYQSPVTHMAGGPTWSIEAMTLDGQRYLSFRFWESSGTPAATYDLMDRNTLRITHHIDRFAVYLLDEDDNMTLDSYITRVDGVEQGRFSNGPIDPDAEQLLGLYGTTAPGQLSYTQLTQF